MPMKELRDIATVTMGQSPPGSLVSDDPSSGLPLLNGPSEFGAAHPFPVQWTREAPRIAEPGDLLFCVRGSTTGRMNWADQRYAIGRGIAAIRPKVAGTADAIRGLIQAELPALLKAATGSTFPNVSRDQLSELPLRLGPEVSLRATSSFLSAIREKIELNREMAAALEDMARALFKSWFVDFDPVHAKAEERDTGLSAGIAALFPNAFDAEGLPAGWSWKRADEIARSVRSTANPQAMPPDTPYVGLEHLPRKSLGISSHGYAHEVESGKLVFEEGDLLFGKLRPYFHKVAVMPFSGIASSDIFVFRAKQERYKGMMYFGFSEDGFVASASGASTGTRMPRAEWSFMSEQVFASDEGEVLEAFNHIALAHAEQIKERLVECRKLEELRATLLPKLLSGELRVPDDETAIAAA